MSFLLEPASLRMQSANFLSRLWGPQAKVHYLLLAAVLMMLCMLGGREIWTQEWRWANISWTMMLSGDYLHPYLAGAPYYDKPLLSYWLMILASHLFGGLNEWALRLPPALAGLLTVWSTYRIGRVLISRQAGLVAAWMLVSTFFFIFWSRTANADMLNLAGIMLAIQWYFEHKDQPGLFSFGVFFLILAVTALFKGLIGIAIPLLAIFPDVLKNQTWKKYLKISLIPAVVPALVIYLLPFWASSHFGGQTYGESGLYLVYKENILRYFSPFDHQGPIYIYFIYLPIYLLPWTLFFIPALIALRQRWSTMSSGSRWTVWSTVLIFLFLTFSGSRRNYYVLPLVPFAILMTADWLASAGARAKRLHWAGYLLMAGYLVFLINFAVIQPLYYAGGGIRAFAREVKVQATHIKPWSEWNIVFLDAMSKVTLYLDAPRPIQLLDPPGIHRRGHEKSNDFTAYQLQTAWPMILSHPDHTIFVTRESYLVRLKPYFKNFNIVMTPPTWGDKVLRCKDPDKPVAFIPAG